MLLFVFKQGNTIY